VANAAIYWYPSTTAGLETIDIGTPLGELQVGPVDIGSSHASLGGHVYDAHLGSYLRLRVQRDFGNSNHALYRNLMTLQNHLNRGGYVGLATDTAKAWAAFVRSTPRRDNTVLNCEQNQFFNTSAALVAGDEVVIESAVPESSREWSTVTSLSSNVLTLAAGLIFDYKQRPILARYEGFYPLLALEGRQQIVTSTQRNYYRMDAVFRTVSKPLALLAQTGTVLPGSTPTTLPHKPNLEEVRRRAGKPGEGGWGYGGRTHGVK
jgi:hypothetical protein